MYIQRVADDLNNAPIWVRQWFNFLGRVPLRYNIWEDGISFTNEPGPNAYWDFAARDETPWHFDRRKNGSK